MEGSGRRVGAYHGRDRAGPDPQRLRARRAGGPGAGAHGTHPQRPRGATATPERAPSARAAQCAAWTDHGRSGLSGQESRRATGGRGTCGLRRQKDAARSLGGDKLSSAKHGAAPPAESRQPNHCTARGNLARTNRVREGAKPGRTRGTKASLEKGRVREEGPGEDAGPLLDGGGATSSCHTEAISRGMMRAKGRTKTEVKPGILTRSRELTPKDYP